MVKSVIDSSYLLNVLLSMILIDFSYLLNVLLSEIFIKNPGLTVALMRNHGTKESKLCFPP